MTLPTFTATAVIFLTYPLAILLHHLRSFAYFSYFSYYAAAAAAASSDERSLLSNYRIDLDSNNDKRYYDRSINNFLHSLLLLGNI